MTEKQGAIVHLKVAAAVQSWMKEYHRHLLDGDPNIIHPKAKAALIVMITELLEAEVEAQVAKVDVSRDAPKRQRLGKEGKLTPVGE